MAKLNIDSYTPRPIRIFSGKANSRLAEEVAKCMGLHVSDMVITQFMDGETYVRIGESVRGCAVFIVQPTSPNVNQNLMELLIMIDAFRRASAARITCVMPYFGYARQDRKVHAREPITAKLVANLLTKAGATRILTVDLHAGQIQGFFDIPLDDLWAFPVFAQYFRQMKLQNFVIVSPDAGGVKRASKLAGELNCQTAFIEKRRDEHNVSQVLHLVGEVNDKNCIILDDLVDTGGTLVNAAKHLKENGAKDIFVAVTHALLSGDCVEKFKTSEIKEIITTNTIDIPDEKRIEKLKILSLASYIADAIKRINLHTSVSQLSESKRDIVLQ